MAKKNSKTRNRPGLAGPLDIQHLAECRAELVTQLAEGSEAMSLDLSKVTACDSAGLQLVCAVRKSARAAGRRWEVINPSPAVVKACAETGLNLQELSL